MHCFTEKETEVEEELQKSRKSTRFDADSEF